MGDCCRKQRHGIVELLIKTALSVSGSLYEASYPFPLPLGRRRDPAEGQRGRYPCRQGLHRRHGRDPGRDRGGGADGLPVPTPSARKRHGKRLSGGAGESRSAVPSPDGDLRKELSMKLIVIDMQKALLVDELYNKDVLLENGQQVGWSRLKE